MDPVAARRRKATWGGSRPGAGRKPVLEDPVRFTVDLEGPDFDALRAAAEEQGISIAEMIRRALRAHLKRQGKL